MADETESSYTSDAPTTHIGYIKRSIGVDCVVTRASARVRAGVRYAVVEPNLALAGDSANGRASVYMCVYIRVRELACLYFNDGCFPPAAGSVHVAFEALKV